MIEDESIYIRSLKFPCICLALYKGEFSILDCEHGLTEDEKKEQNGFYTDNKDFAFEVYKVLNRGVELGAFGEVKDEPAKEVFV